MKNNPISSSFVILNSTLFKKEIERQRNKKNLFAGCIEGGCSDFRGHSGNTIAYYMHAAHHFDEFEIEYDLVGAIINNYFDAEKQNEDVRSGFVLDGDVGRVEIGMKFLKNICRCKTLDDHLLECGEGKEITWKGLKRAVARDELEWEDYWNGDNGSESECELSGCVSDLEERVDVEQGVRYDNTIGIEEDIQLEDDETVTLNTDTETRTFTNTTDNDMDTDTEAIETRKGNRHGEVSSTPHRLPRATGESSYDASEEEARFVDVAETQMESDKEIELATAAVSFVIRRATRSTRKNHPIGSGNEASQAADAGDNQIDSGNSEDEEQNEIYLQRANPLPALPHRLMRSSTKNSPFESKKDLEVESNTLDFENANCGSAIELGATETVLPFQARRTTRSTSSKLHPDSNNAPQYTNTMTQVSTPKNKADLEPTVRPTYKNKTLLPSQTPRHHIRSSGDTKANNTHCNHMDIIADTPNNRQKTKRISPDPSLPSRRTRSNSKPVPKTQNILKQLIPVLKSDTRTLRFSKSSASIETDPTVATPEAPTNENGRRRGSGSPESLSDTVTVDRPAAERCQQKKRRRGVP
ncbi:MAG: hypothetical protein QM734_12425 [Cyclobacteriaceae bacterium]